VGVWLDVSNSLYEEVTGSSVAVPELVVLSTLSTELSVAVGSSEGDSVVFVVIGNM
jgi:hypothetical protein